MTSRLANLHLDAVDPTRVAEFWIVLADPEGNEFCLLSRSVQDLAADERDRVDRS